MKVTFVTGNSWKFKTAQKVLSTYGIDVVQRRLGTPEIQSTDPSEIAKYSARYAADKLGGPVIVTDVGWYISALNGFPGPFIKYVNEWLGPDDFMRLLEGAEDRAITAREVVAYCEPGGEAVSFETNDECTITTTPDYDANTTTLNKILVLKGHTKVSSQLTEDELIDYWSKNLTHYSQFGEYYSRNNNS